MTTDCDIHAYYPPPDHFWQRTKAQCYCMTHGVAVEPEKAATGHCSAVTDPQAQTNATTSDRQS